MRRALPHRLSMVIACLWSCGWLAGCGELHFVVSPYTPQQLRVVYSEQEDLTLIAWRLGTQVDVGNVRFELLVDGEWKPLDFASSPYPAGEFDCATTCFQYNLAGRYTAPKDGLILRSLHPEHGTLLNAPIAVQVNRTTLSITPRMKPTNRQVNLLVSDFFDEIGTPERRTYRYHFFESSTFPCPAESATWTTQFQGQDPVSFALPTDEPRVCVVLQPVPRRSFTPVTLAAPVWMHPELQSRQFTYDVPVETSPNLYQLVFDLQIPDAARCESTMQSIAQQIASAFKARNSQTHAFDVVNLGDDGTKRCNQRADRTFSGVTVAEAIKSYINTSVQQPRGAKVVLIYVNNNSLPPPMQVAGEVVTLVDSLRNDPRVRVFAWAIATDAVLNQFPWDAQMGWVTPGNSAFAETLTATANSTLPFKSLDHDNAAPLRFLDPLFEGIAGEFKSCSSSPTAQYYVNGQFAFPPPNHTAYILNLGDELRFQVGFPEQDFVRSSEFSPQKALIRYEICAKWCSHPFYSAKDEWIGSAVDLAGQPNLQGWDREVRCREAL